MSNERPEKEKIIIKHLTTVRCPSCGEFYLPQDGHTCRNRTKEREFEK